MIGLGIVTYNRPEYFEKVWEGVEKNLLDVVNRVIIYDDGSTKANQQKLKEIVPKHIELHLGKKNMGVAFAKNHLLTHLIDNDYIFLLEDDVIPTSEKAVTEYIKASDTSGIPHLMFAHHGPANVGDPVKVEDDIEYYPNAVGAWCLYKRESIEECGYMDENFENAWEHVEHTWRIMQSYGGEFWEFPDIKNSHKYLKEIPESINNSKIRQDPEFFNRLVTGLDYWNQKDPNFPLKDVADRLGI